MRFSHIFFDLDGTLTDPALGITNSIVYARKKWGLPCGPNREYYPFIGPPMPKSFEELWGFSAEDAKRFLADYREYFSVKGLFENEVYPGIIELLQKLKAAGAHLYVATTKPTEFSLRIADHFGLTPYFDLISGSDMDGGRVAKRDVIAYARDACGVPMTSAVLVGDRRHDVIGAHQCCIPCVGVTYGYGGRSELTEASADFLADTVEELSAFLLN
jgi:phosphoglycolate phosphatase